MDFLKLACSDFTLCNGCEKWILFVSVVSVTFSKILALSNILRFYVYFILISKGKLLLVIE
jgi:hypothetical protein